MLLLFLSRSILIPFTWNTEWNANNKRLRTVSVLHTHTHRRRRGRIWGLFQKSKSTALHHEGKHVRVCEKLGGFHVFIQLTLILWTDLRSGVCPVRDLLSPDTTYTPAHLSQDAPSTHTHKHESTSRSFPPKLLTHTFLQKNTHIHFAARYDLTSLFSTHNNNLIPQHKLLCNTITSHYCISTNSPEVSQTNATVSMLHQLLITQSCNVVIKNSFKILGNMLINF